MDNDYIPSGADNAEDVEDIIEELEEIEEETVEGEEVAEEKKEVSVFSNPIDILLKYHPECILDYEENEQLNVPIESTLGDKYHRSPPFLTIYERTKILGMRTNQLAQGAKPYIVVPEHITDVQEIAKLEIEQRKLPLIVKRHMPDGSYEKFRLSDLIII